MKKFLLIVLLGISLLGILTIAHDTAKQISSQQSFQRKLNVHAEREANRMSIMIIGLALAGAAGSFYRYSKIKS